MDFRRGRRSSLTRNGNAKLGKNETFQGTQRLTSKDSFVGIVVRPVFVHVHREFGIGDVTGLGTKGIGEKDEEETLFGHL